MIAGRSRRGCSAGFERDRSLMKMQARQALGSRSISPQAASTLLQKAEGYARDAIKSGQVTYPLRRR